MTIDDFFLLLFLVSIIISNINQAIYYMIVCGRVQMSHRLATAHLPSCTHHNNFHVFTPRESLHGLK
jgi:hypothetical protein